MTSVIVRVRGALPSFSSSGSDKCLKISYTTSNGSCSNVTSASRFGCNERRSKTSILEKFYKKKSISLAVSSSVLLILPSIAIVIIDNSI